MQPDLFGHDPCPPRSRRRRPRLERDQFDPLEAYASHLHEKIERTHQALAESLAESVEDLRHRLDPFDDGEIAVAIEALEEEIDAALESATRALEP